jgi:hypothetical protein
MKKRRRSLGRPLLHARALCDHGAPRSEIAAKAPCGRPGLYIYWVVQLVCRKSDPRP